MNLRNHLIGVTASVGLLGWSGLSAEERKWTSASDASKTFMGELVGVSGKNVTVKIGETEKTFDISVLSAADQAFVKANGAKLAAQTAANPAAAEIRANLARGAVSSGAEYYLLYFAQST